MKKQWKTGAAVVKIARKVVKEAGHSIKDCQLSIPEEGNTAKVFITITDGMKTQPDALHAMGGKLKRLQRWVNNKWVFWKCSSFDEYMKM